MLAANTADSPAYRFVRNDVGGYARVDMLPDRATTTFRPIGAPNDPSTTAYDLARFYVQSGSLELAQ